LKIVEAIRLIEAAQFPTISTARALATSRCFGGLFVDNFSVQNPTASQKAISCCPLNFSYEGLDFWVACGASVAAAAGGAAGEPLPTTRQARLSIEAELATGLILKLRAVADAQKQTSRDDTVKRALTEQWADTRSRRLQRSSGPEGRSCARRAKPRLDTTGGVPKTTDVTVQTRRNSNTDIAIFLMGKAARGIHLAATVRSQNNQAPRHFGLGLPSEIYCKTTGAPGPSRQRGGRRVGGSEPSISGSPRKRIFPTVTLGGNCRVFRASQASNGSAGPSASGGPLGPALSRKLVRRRAHFFFFFFFFFFFPSATSVWHRANYDAAVRLPIVRLPSPPFRKFGRTKRSRRSAILEMQSQQQQQAVRLQPQESLQF